PYHELLREADTIAGMPVVAADLHSARTSTVRGHRTRRGARGAPHRGRAMGAARATRPREEFPSSPAS
ncbi:hypothetical protein ACRQFE_08935, partial [Actinotignum sp. GS-2025c]